MLGAGCSSSPAIDGFAEAERLLGGGEFHAAIAGFSMVVDRYPESEVAAKSQYMTGYIYLRHINDLDRAMESFSALFYLYPRSPEVYLARKDRVEVFSSRGEHLRAIEELQWVVKKAPANERDGLKLRIALEYEKVNEFRAARAELAELMETTVDPALLARVSYHRAALYYLEGDCEKAIEAFDQVASRFPGDNVAMDARLGTAVCLEETGRLAEALSMLKALLGVYPNEQAVKIRMASIEERISKGPSKKK